MASDTATIRHCAPLLGQPAAREVIGLCDEIDELRERCARLEREKDEERRKFVDAAAPYFSSRVKADAVADLADALDRCASLEAALRQVWPLAGKEWPVPRHLSDAIRAILGPAPDGKVNE